MLNRHYRNAGAVIRRELAGYFGSPVAYVYIIIFLLLCGFLTFFVSRFFENMQADLQVFFQWLPWLYLFLVPAVAMRLWADERRSGTLELVLTLPMTLSELIIGKFLSAWLVIGISLLLTFPLVGTVSFLGDPDLGPIFSGYVGSFLLAGAYLSVGCMTSSCTRNQIISFITSVVLCLFLLMAGWAPVIDIFSGWAHNRLVDLVAGFSFFPHFTSMARGVIDGRDLIYFMSVIVSMLFLNGVILCNRQTINGVEPVGKKIRINNFILSKAGIFFTLILVIVVNVLFSGLNFRLDMTEEKIYSLSEGTKKILSNISYPVTIKFYFSQSNVEMPIKYKLFAKRTREFLLEYKLAAGGNIVFEYYDPKPDTVEEAWAHKFGLSTMRTESGAKVFCGLVFLQADLEERIGWLAPDREATLEYDLTRTISHLQSANKKNIGVISFLPVFGGVAERNTGGGAGNAMAGSNTGGPWSFITELEKNYKICRVPHSADRIDPNIDLLFVIHPKDMHPDLRFAVDQYILRGGNALFFVDPLCFSESRNKNQNYMAGSKRSTEKLFNAWGIKVDFDKIVAAMGSGHKSMDPGNGDTIRVTAIGNAFNSQSPVTAALDSMLFRTSGAITFESKNSELEFVSLIKASDSATLIPVTEVGRGSAYRRKRSSPEAEPPNLAVQLRGRFKTGFPKGPPVIPEGSPGPEQLKTSGKPSTVIVVADADILTDTSYMRPSIYYGHETPKVINDNLNFIANACEVLTGSDNLISLRTRGKFERPFSRVMALEKEAQEKWRDKEAELVQKNEALHRQLRDLESHKSPFQPNDGLSPKQTMEIEKVKNDQKRIAHELKSVRKKFRRDIEILGAAVKAANLLMMPLLVVVFGIGYNAFRRMRMHS